MKRLMDSVGAVVGLLVLAPFFPFIALAIVLDSPGPVFMKQRRVSRGRTFTLYKFRTMVRNAEDLRPVLAHLNERKDGPYFKIRNDPRVTRVGRWLRRYRIDEFPQFINVLRGDMSVVGPRPYTPEEIAAYPPPYRRLAMATAGITGLSQISGSSTLSFKKTLELDDWYVNHQSCWLDCRIIAKTIAITLIDHTAV